MRRVLIIGGTRNLGPSIARKFLEAGNAVTVLNRGVTPGELPEGVERLRADRSDVQQMRTALGTREFDVVVDTTLYNAADAKSTVELLNGRVGRYIFISTGQVVAATGAKAQYLRKTTPILEQQDFYKSPERDHIENDTFRRIDRVIALPRAARDYLGDMADPGEHWQECPPIFNSTLPERRLLFAAASGDHLIVYYETGICRDFSRFRFDIFSLKQDFLFDAMSFESPTVDPFPEEDCSGFPMCDRIPAVVVPAKSLIHRGSGYTSKKLESIEELKAAILASRAD